MADRIAELVAKAEAAMRRRGASPDQDKPLKVVYSNDLKGLAMYRDGVIYVSGKGADDWSSLDALAPWIYHEVAHAYAQDKSNGGHNEEWASVFLPSVEEDLDQKAVGVVMNHFTKKYPELDAEAALNHSGRHSTGGTVGMTHQEAVQLLVDRGGWNPQEAERLVSGLVASGTVSGNTEGDIDPTSLQQYLPDEVDPRFEPSSRRPSQTGRTESRTEQAEFSRLSEAVERNMVGAATAEDQEVVASSTEEDIAAAIAAITEERTEFNYDWVYNNLQLDPGSLDTTEALLSLIPQLEEIAGIEIDEEADDVEMQIKSILQRNHSNVMVQAAVAEWGRETGTYMTPAEQQFAGLMAQGVSAARAKTLQAVGQQFDIDPTQLWQIWENSKGKHGPNTVFGQSVPDVVGVKKTPFQLAKDFKEGLDMYEGSNVLAALHASDPELAADLRNDPYGLDSGELQRALDFLGQGGTDGPEGAVGASSDPQINWIKTRLAGGYTATATVDSGAVKEAVQTLAQAWNLVGQEDVAASVASDVVAGAVARARAQLPNPFGPLKSGVNVIDSVENVEARIRQRLRGSGEYQELFGHKQAAESEEEYVSRFENRSQSVLGDDNSSVVRNAMRTGNVNSVYQQALHTEAGDSSTRFQEILARNAQVFRELL